MLPSVKTPIIAANGVHPNLESGRLKYFTWTGDENIDMCELVITTFSSMYNDLTNSIKRLESSKDIDLNTEIKNATNIINKKISHVIELCRNDAIFVILFDQRRIDPQALADPELSSKYYSWFKILDDLVISKINGQEITLKTEDRTEECLVTLKNFSWYYMYSHKSESAHPIILTKSRIVGGGETVGSYKRLGDKGGYIMLLPNLMDYNEVYDGENVLAFQKFTDVLFEFRAALGKEGLPAAIPNWATSYVTRREKTLIHDLEKSRQQLRSIKQEIEAREGAWDRECFYKQLWTESGEKLVACVKAVLEKMGVPVVFGPQSRADLIAHHDGTIVTIEIQASGEAAETWMINQCQDWVSDVEGVLAVPEEDWDDVRRGYARALDELDGQLRSDAQDRPAGSTKVRGVLLLNSFKSMKLEDRPEVSFGADFQESLAKRDLSAATTLQLFGLMQQYGEDEEAGVRYLKELLLGQGIWGQFSDWRAFLEG